MPICPICNNYFDFYKSKIYCSHGCSYQAQKDRMYAKRNNGVNQDWKKERKCFICEKGFIPRSTNQINCSRVCSNKGNDFSYISQNLDKFNQSKTNYITWLKIRVVVLNRDNFSCKYCGRSPMNEDGVILHIDHKIPKNQGGDNSIDNLITACAECNLGKSDLILSFWKNEKNSVKKKNKIKTSK